MEVRKVWDWEADLCSRFEAFCTAHGYGPCSADELLCFLQYSDDAIDSHISWVKTFIDEWEQWEDARHLVWDEYWALNRKLWEVA